MPDTRKHILVEPETHQEFMTFVIDNRMTQNTGLLYLLRKKPKTIKPKKK